MTSFTVSSSDSVTSNLNITQGTYGTSTYTNSYTTGTYEPSRITNYVPDDYILGGTNSVNSVISNNIYTNSATYSTELSSYGTYSIKDIIWYPMQTIQVYSGSDSIWVNDPAGLSKKDQLRVKLRDNLVPSIKSRNKLLEKVLPNNELVALETLREELSETEYRKYLKHGFVLVKGKSGDIYQVFRNKSHTKVWRGGKLIEEICVRIKDKSIPETDNVIAFKTMIEVDENEFKELGNRYKFAS
jgi:hypothetical protein